MRATSSLKLAAQFSEGYKMECAVKDELEQHLSDIRKFAARLDLTPDERELMARAERSAIGLLQETQRIWAQRQKVSVRDPGFIDDSLIADGATATATQPVYYGWSHQRTLA